MMRYYNFFKRCRNYNGFIDNVTICEVRKMSLFLLLVLVLVFLTVAPFGVITVRDLTNEIRLLYGGDEK
jgi:hypothetical protein